MIEIREARYFLAVAQTLHFGRAAEQLAMSQPPLSQAILQLERRLGVKLFERSKRSVALTEAGRIFERECRSIVAAAQQAEDAVTQADAGLMGTLRLGAVTHALGDQLRTAIADFRRTRPLVDLAVTHVGAHAACEKLRRRDIDVAIAPVSAPTRDLRKTPWYQDHMVIALPSGHPVLDEDATNPVELARFADDDWVWLPRTTAPDYVDQLTTLCYEAGFSPNVQHLADTIMAEVAMVACGLGVALIPRMGTRFLPDSATYRALVNRADLIELCIVTRDGQHEPLVEQFRHTALALRR